METISARWRSSSLRSQLMVLTGMLLAISIAVTSFVALSVLRDSMINEIDSDLRDSLNAASASLMAEMSGGSPTAVPHQGYLLDAQGNVVETIDRTSAAEPMDNAPDLSLFDREMVLRAGQNGMTVSSAGDGVGSWRVVAAPQARTEYSVVVAQPLGPTNGLISAISVLTLSLGAVVLFVALVAAWALITRAFLPLRRVEQTAARIAQGDLSQRISGSGTQTEVGQLSSSLNRMLGHIEDAFDARTRSEAKLRQFVADASHELRTPLVTIRGYSELYRHGALPTQEQVGQAMGRIEAEATRMTRLVEDLLSLARLDTGRTFEATDVDLLILAHDAASDFAAANRDRRIRVTDLRGGTATPVWTRGDEAQLRQVIVNLMTNAVRYSPEGTDLEIMIGTSPAAVHGADGQPVSRAVIKIRDHGPGIKGADREKIFERFYRADTSRTRETGGTGLGLSIVSAVVDQHRGDVTLEDTPGGGATFVVTLPKATTPEPPPETDRFDEVDPPIPEIDDDDPDVIDETAPTPRG